MTEDGPVPVVNRGAVIPFSDDLLLSFVAVVRYSGPGEPHVVSVVVLSEMTAIGSIKWVVGKNDDPEIGLIHVVQEYRRRGIATLLLTVANEVADREGWPRPEHSPLRTPDGDGWAQSRGAAPAEEIDDADAWVQSPGGAPAEEIDDSGSPGASIQPGHVATERVFAQWRK